MLPDEWLLSCSSPKAAMPLRVSHTSTPSICRPSSSDERSTSSSWSSVVDECCRGVGDGVLDVAGHVLRVIRTEPERELVPIDVESGGDGDAILRSKKENGKTGFQDTKKEKKQKASPRGFKT